MKIPSTLAALSGGALIGACLVVACSDDSPADADAAVCECPAAEPPLQDRIVPFSQSVSVTMTGGGGGTGCPDGATLISGGCLLEGADGTVKLAYAGIFRGGPSPVWRCEWGGTAGATINGTVEAICLLPPAK